jgi:DNA-binding transcriptional MerR regulator
MAEVYSLAELAEAWTRMHPEDPITPRTLRYYITQDLLEGPGRVGPGKHYKDRHLEQIKAIRLMQQNGGTIEGIRSLLSGLDPGNIEVIIKEQEKILKMRANAEQRVRSTSSMTQNSDEDNNNLQSVDQTRSPSRSKGITPFWKRKTPVSQAQWEGISWIRVTVAPGIEVFIREDLGKQLENDVRKWLDQGSALLTGDNMGRKVDTYKSASKEDKDGDE